MNLNGKTVVLTGATGGIGQAVAIAIADKGASLILVSRSADKLAAILPTLPGSGHKVVAADITLTQGRQKLVECVGGQVDVLINSAGINHFGLISEQTEQQITQMMEVNLLAPILLTRSLLPALSHPGGTVVNMGSSFGSIGFAGYCGYSASKFGLRGFTEALRREMANSGPRVIYLAPRATDTAMNPAEVVAMNRELGNTMDPPERVARELIAILDSSKSVGFIGWPERFFVKLNSLFPSIVDSALAKQLPVIRRRAVAGAPQEG
ncbi:MAG: SDR family oxidoreductase [Halioglobus sp.]